MSLVELERFYSEVEADLVRLRLDAAGIESFVFDRMIPTLGFQTGIRLMVDENDAAAARRILSEQS